MTERIRLVIQAEDGPGEPEDAFEPEAGPDGQADAENAPGGDSGDSSGILASPATAPGPVARPIGGAYPPCAPQKHTVECLNVYGPCVNRPVTLPATFSYASSKAKCEWCRGRKEHYYLTLRTVEGKTERYCTKYCYERNSAYKQKVAGKAQQEPRTTPSENALDRWPVAQVQLVCASCWEEPCVCMSWPTGGVPL